ncbi:MAG: hypothetical protein IRZ13_13865 [Acetobacteraceae bacterium]|nr:hypothetical protein [Acetobacteraceae bacterium]
MSDDPLTEPPPPLPDPVPPQPSPDPVTMEDLVEELSRTPDELAALDAQAEDPDAQALEALKQHLRHEQAPPGTDAAAPPAGSRPRPTEE